MTDMNSEVDNQLKVCTVLSNIIPAVVQKLAFSLFIALHAIPSNFSWSYETYFPMTTRPKRCGHW